MIWFVYDNETYYPMGSICEAETAEEAARQVKGTAGGWEGNQFLVFPLDALAVDIGDTVAEIQREQAL